jgi:hypothetical protein
MMHDDFGKSLKDLLKSQSSDLPKKQSVFSGVFVIEVSAVGK